MERNGSVGNYVCAVYSFVQLRVLLRRDSCRADLAPFVVVSIDWARLYVCAWHTFVQLRALVHRDSCRADPAPFVAVSRLGSMLSRAENGNGTCVGHRTDVALVTVPVLIRSGF